MAVDSLSAATSVDTPRGPRWLWILAPIALWLLLAALLALLAGGISSPRRYQDEFLYWALAHSLAAGDGLTWNGGPYPIVSSFYPLLMSLAVHAVDGVAAQFALIKNINALAMSAVVFPVYVAARWFAAPGLALLAALMAGLVPAMNFVGMIETEALAYPLAAAALLALVYAIGRPGLAATCTFAAFFALALLARLQFVGILPVAALAAALSLIWLDPERRARQLAALRSFWILLAALLIIGAAYKLARGGAASGIYYVVLHPARIEWGDIGYWLRAFTADLYILCAFLPAIATFALLGSRARKTDPLVSALAAVAIVASVVFVLQMTWFTAVGFEHARERHILYERYIFYLGPLYFVGLIAALKHASARAVAISTIVAALLICLLPTQAIEIPYSQDAFSQAYLGYLIDGHPGLLGWSGILMAAIAALLGALFAYSLRGDRARPAARYARALAFILPLFLMLITQLKAWSYQQIYADGVRDASPQPLNWIERATDGRVAQLVTSDTDRTALYLAQFWNPVVQRLYVSSEAPIGSFAVTAPQCELRWLANGLIRPSPQAGCALPPRGWLVDSGTTTMHLRDEAARIHPHGRPEVTLTIAREAPQLLALVGGRKVKTGEVEEALVVRSFADRPGRIRLRLAASGSALVVGLPGGKRLTLEPGSARTVTFAVGSGDQLSSARLLTGEGELFVRSIGLREGVGAWRSID